jgi:hypothetical protein
MVVVVAHQQIKHKAAVQVEVVVVAEMLVLKVQMVALELLDKDLQAVAAMLVWVVQTLNIKVVVVEELVE